MTKQKKNRATTFKRASSFTPEGQAAAATILRKIVAVHSNGNIREFTEKLDESLKERGIVRAQELDPSTVFRTVNTGNLEVKPNSRRKNINPQFFEYFEPFYPEGLSIEDMYAIASGRQEPPPLSTLRFPLLTKKQSYCSSRNINDKEGKHNILYLIINQSSYSILDSDDISCIHEGKMRMPQLSRSQLSKLSSIFRASIKKDETIRKTIKLQQIVLKLVEEDSWIAEDKVTLSECIFMEFAKACFKVIEWQNGEPILSDERYGEDWRQLFADTSYCCDDCVVLSPNIT